MWPMQSVVECGGEEHSSNSVGSIRRVSHARFGAVVFELASGPIVCRTACQAGTVAASCDTVRTTDVRANGLYIRCIGAGVGHGTPGLGPPVAGEVYQRSPPRLFAPPEIGRELRRGPQWLSTARDRWRLFLLASDRSGTMAAWTPASRISTERPYRGRLNTSCGLRSAGCYFSWESLYSSRR